MVFDPTQLTYLNTIDNGDSTTDVIFVCDNFTYSVRCFEGIIQFIKGQRPEDLLYDGSSATSEQLELNDLRREFYNGDHAPLQTWIDSL
jgi:hypothetical protein